jgi:hypothetical protein
VGGSSANFVGAGVYGATIAGGGAVDYQGRWFYNDEGGFTNSILADFGTISGGNGNNIQTNSEWSTIGGGVANSIQHDAQDSTISGGFLHTIEANAYGSVIAGGDNNTVQMNAGFGTISGGLINTIQTNAEQSTIGGGYLNTISTNARVSTIGGGYHNSITGSYGVVPGGDRNVAGTNGFAAGRRANAIHQGAFVWADSRDVNFSSIRTNEFSARATGGVRFVSGIDTSGNVISGVQLPSGGGSWASLSDRNAKENVEKVQGREILKRLAAIPIATWNYKSQDTAVRHIGPMAQDFAAAFNVGEDEKHIATVDADGVALAAIQGLNQVVKEKETEIEDLKKRLTMLEQLVKTLVDRK